MTPAEDRALRSRISVKPDLCNGRPTIRGLRITAETVLEHLAAGDTAADILAAYPVLEPDDIRACLALARDLLHNRGTVVAAE